MRSAVDGVDGGGIEVAYRTGLEVDVVSVECGQVLVVKAWALTPERVTGGQFLTDGGVGHLAAHVPQRGTLDE